MKSIGRLSITEINSLAAPTMAVDVSLSRWGGGIVSMSMISIRIIPHKCWNKYIQILTQRLALDSLAKNIGLWTMRGVLIVLWMSPILRIRLYRTG